jgi:ATP-dependent RNA helicase SUPV3L1/SUV3
MAGLGYKADKGERVKVKAPRADVAGDPPVESPVETSDQPDDAPVLAEVPDEMPQEMPQEIPQEIPGDAPPQTPDAPEMELFYTFTWGGRAARPARPANDRPRGNAKPKGKPKGKPQMQQTKPDSFQAKPKREKQIDPDNPFAAALAGFKKA